MSQCQGCGWEADDGRMLDMVQIADEQRVKVYLCEECEGFLTEPHQVIALDATGVQVRLENYQCGKCGSMVPTELMVPIIDDDDDEGYACTSCARR